MGQLRRTLSGALKKGDVVPSGATSGATSGVTPTYNPSSKSGTTNTNSMRRKATSKKKGY